MARTRPYTKKKTMTPRTKYAQSSASSSSSSSSHHATPHPSPSPTPSTPDSHRGRRGRQARPSQLTPGMHRAVRRFAHLIGAPNVVEPAGFRDFRGWLARLAARESRPCWDQLLATIARDVGCDLDAVHALKEDVVREIVKCVVVPRPDESAKLVSTNAGRQASRPRSGTTLMVVLDQQLDRVKGRLAELVGEMAPVSPARSDEGLDGMYGAYHHGGSPARHGAAMGQSVDKLPSVSDILGERRGSSTSRQSLPSFRELDDSLRRNGSGSGSGSR